MMDVTDGTGTVVVTGASRGIGRATAHALVDAGLAVYGTVRSSTDADDMARATDGMVTPLLCDVTDRASVAEAAAFVAEREEARGLMGLVNNAGIARAGPLEMLPVEAWRESFEVNVLGVVRVTRAFLPLLRQGRGRIVNVSSASALVPIPFLGPYVTSKTALDRLSQILRLELRPWGIAVVSVQPGLVDTGIAGRSLEVSEELLAEASAGVRALYEPVISRMRRAGQERTLRGTSPDRVARTILRTLTVRRPRRTYHVGCEPKLLAIADRWMPDGLREWLTAQLLLGARDG
jgi:NAD(P)-dependent dehydrogenase (short-subunit alcohol dehydrogenase family)